MMMFRRHDRYVLKAYWAAFGAVLLFFSLIVVIIHMSDRLARVVRYWEPLKEAGWNPIAVVVEYYATLLPFIWMQIVPLAAVLAATFALSRLTRHNELSPLVTAGVSTRRITLPLLVSGLAIGALLFGLQEVLVPRLSRRNMTLERLLNKHEPSRISKVPHFDDPGGARLSVATFRPFDLHVEGALMTMRDEEGRVGDVYWYPLLRWDEETVAWVAERDGTQFTLGGEGGTAPRRTVPAADRVPLEADLPLFEVSSVKGASLGLSTRETGALIAADPDNPRLLLLHHQLYSRAFVPLVLLLMGMPFALHLGRRSAVPGVIAVLGTGAIYYATTFLATSLASSGDFNPVVLAWLPVVQFGTIGAAFWLTMES